ncbi:MAG: hypothetical protein GC168_18335 [Candidatus Hydrogenedens sp.]|nr:hypothetical protein [Candidatus Hydrogenedens sp.]
MKKRPRKGNEGVALMLVLMFVVLLAAIIVEFAYDAEVDASLTMNQGSDFEAYLAAKSAVAEGMALLAEDLVLFDENGNPVNQSASLTGQAADPQYDVGRADFSPDSWSLGTAFEQINEAERRTTVSDEYGKINLNALLQYNPETDELERNEPLIETLKVFFATRNETDGETEVDSILDWLDYNDDDNTEPNGAENDYYQGLENPYSCKNGPMDHIEELLLVQGFTPEMYYGDQTLDPPMLPLSETLTVHGAPSGAININSAADEVIAAVVDGWSTQGYTFNFSSGPPYLSWQTLQGEVQNTNNQADPNNPNGRRNRQNPNPGVNPDPSNPNGDPTTQWHPFITWSNCFRIFGDGRHDQTKVRIEAYVWRRPYEQDQSQYVTETWSPIQKQNMQAYLGDPGTDTDTAMDLLDIEQFRILDWRVIR